MPFRLDTLKFVVPVSLLALAGAGCSGGGASMQSAVPVVQADSAARTVSSGGSARPSSGGGGGGGSASSSNKVVGVITGKSSSNPIGYYAVYDLYVVNGETYHLGAAKIDLQNGPAELGACVTLTTFAANGQQYFSKLVTELPSLCP